MMNQTPQQRWFVLPPPPAQPVDDFAEARDSLPAGEASARIVVRSLLTLTGLGLGALFLMYSSVHAGDSQSSSRRMTGGAAQSDRPQWSAIAEAIAAAPSTETAILAPIPIATKSSMAVTSLDAGTVSGAFEAKRPPSVAVRPIFVAPPSAITAVRIEPNPGPAPATNPYDEPSTKTASARQTTSPRAREEVAVGPLESRK